MAWVPDGKGDYYWQQGEGEPAEPTRFTPKPTVASAPAGAQPTSGGANTSRLGVSTSIDREDPAQVEQERTRQDQAASEGFYSDPKTGIQDRAPGNPQLLDFTNRMGRTAGAYQQGFETQSDRDRRQRKGDYQDIVSRYDAIGHDNTESDESRASQEEALKMQRQIFERALNFDPNAVAQDESDRTLKQLLIAGSSQRGGAGAQQAGRQAALQQAPSVFGEAQRNARQEGLARNAQALEAANAFGGQSTATRQQDEQRSAYESDLGVRVTDSVANLTGQKWNLDEQSNQNLGRMAVEYARLQASGVQMSAQQQIAWWDQQSKRYAVDKNFDAMMRKMAADEPSTFEKILGALSAGPALVGSIAGISKLAGGMGGSGGGGYGAPGSDGSEFGTTQF